MLQSEERGNIVRLISASRDYSNGKLTVALKIKGSWLEKLGVTFGQKYMIRIVTADKIILERVS